MIPDAIAPLVRRAILDLLDHDGGEQNDDVITLLLAQLGHRIARRDVAEQLNWLSQQGLVDAEAVGPFIVARTTSDGRDIAAGRLVVDGVWRHKTGS